MGDWWLARSERWDARQARVGVRFREAGGPFRRVGAGVGDWWLGQSERWDARQARVGVRFREAGGPFQRVGATVGDWWFDLGWVLGLLKDRLRRARGGNTAGEQVVAIRTGLAHGARGITIGVTRRLGALRARTARGLGAARTRATGATGVLGTDRARRLALAAAAVVVVGGAALAGLRLPSGRTPADQGQPGRDEAAQDANLDAGDPLAGGPGLTEPGIYLSVTPEGSGDLEVVERIITPEPISMLPLSAPPRVPRSGGPAARLVALEVVADDLVVPVGGLGLVDQPTLSLPRPATTVELRYRVVDADEQKVTAPPDRATLSLRPATAAALATSPAVVAVRGAVVHAMVCVDAPLERQLCGLKEGAGWHTEPVTAATSTVLALVDLPKP